MRRTKLTKGDRWPEVDLSHLLFERPTPAAALEKKHSNKSNWWVLVSKSSSSTLWDGAAAAGALADPDRRRRLVRGCSLCGLRCAQAKAAACWPPPPPRKSRSRVFFAPRSRCPIQIAPCDRAAGHAARRPFAFSYVLITCHLRTLFRFPPGRVTRRRRSAGLVCDRDRRSLRAEPRRLGW